MADVRSAVSSATRTPRCTVLDAVQRTGSGAESGGAVRPTLRGAILGVSVIGSREPSQERLIDLRRECPSNKGKHLRLGFAGGHAGAGQCQGPLRDEPWQIQPDPVSGLFAIGDPRFAHCTGELEAGADPSAARRQRRFLLCRAPFCALCLTGRCETAMIPLCGGLRLSYCSVSSAFR